MASFAVCPPHCTRCLSPDGDALGLGSRGRGALVLRVGVVGAGLLKFLGTGLAVEETGLLDGAAGLNATGDAAVVLWSAVPVGGAVDGGREVGDLLGNRVLGADGAGIDAVALAGLGHGVVARVEVFAVLEVLGEVIGARGKLAVEAEKTLLLGGKGRDVDLVLLVGVHSGQLRGNAREKLVSRSDGSRLAVET